MSSFRLYLSPSYARFLLTSRFFGSHPAFGAFWAECSPLISLSAPLQGMHCLYKAVRPKLSSITRTLEFLPYITRPKPFCLILKEL